MRSRPVAMAITLVLSIVFSVSADDNLKPPAGESPDGAETTEIVASDGSFRLAFPIKLPAKDVFGIDPRKPRSIAKSLPPAYTFSDGRMTYVLMVTDRVAELNDEEMEQSLGSARDIQLKSQNGKLLRQKKIEIEGGRGLEFTYSHPPLKIGSDEPGIYCVRLIYVGKRSYEMSAAGSSSVFDEQKARTFLDSFKLLKKDPGAASAATQGSEPLLGHRPADESDDSRQLVVAVPWAKLAGHPGAVTCAAWSREDARLVTGSDDATARLWNVQDAKPVMTFEGHATEVAAVALSVNGRRVATADAEGTVRVWDAGSGKPLWRRKAGLESVIDLAFSPDAKLLACYSADDEQVQFTLWDAATGKPRRNFAHQASGTMVFSQDGKVFAAADLEDGITLWDVKKGRKLRSFEPDGDVLQLAFSPQGKLLAAVIANDRDRTLEIWNVAKGARVRRFAEDFREVDLLAFVSEDELTAFGRHVGPKLSLERIVKSWSVKTGEALRTVWASGHFGQSVLANSPDGRWLATAGRNDTVDIWNLAELADEPLQRAAGPVLAGGGQFTRDGERWEIQLFVKDEKSVAALSALKDFPYPLELNLRSSNKLTDEAILLLQPCKNLRALSLSMNEHLTDKGLAQVAGQVGLERLELDSIPGITDAGLSHLQGLANLESLDLGFTGVTGAGLAQLAKFTRLRSLKLMSVPVRDSELGALTGLQELVELNLHDTRITDAGLAMVAKLPKLRKLSLSLTQVTDAGLDNLAALPELESLDICNLNVSNDGLAKLKSLARLRHLRIGGSGLASHESKKMDDEGFVHLGELTELSELEFEGFPEFQGPGLVHLAKLPKLVSLDLSPTGVTDVGLEHVVGMVQLESLTLPKEIGDAGLRHVAALKNLRRLNLGWTQITDAGLANIARLEKLTKLKLSNTAIGDEGLKHLAGLKNLKEVWLINTQVTEQGRATLREAVPQAEIW